MESKMCDRFLPRPHQPADDSTKQPFTVAGETAGIRNFLSEPHRNSFSNASDKPTKLLVNGL
jgi:hypothetical protein